MEGGPAGMPVTERHLRFDAAVMRMFPYFVAFFAVFSFVLMYFYFPRSYTVGHFLYSICCSYTVGFMVLGVPSFILYRKRAYSLWKVVPVFLALSTLLGSVLWLVFGTVDNSPNEFIASFVRLVLEVFGAEDVYRVSAVTVVLGTDLLFAVFALASYGVLEVVTAYFGKNYHRILLSLARPGDGRLKRTSQKMFMVPDIIDVTEVTLGPDLSESFATDLFRKVYGYVLIIGIVIASYLFLNPVFLDTIPHTNMMLIVMLLSLFVSAIVIPCSIVRSLGAEALSAGARPYALWKGIRAKLFHGGFYLMLFLTLLWVCMFTDADLTRIFVSYISYVCFMSLLAALVSFIYVNSFYREFRNLIISNFDSAKNGK